MTQTLKNLTLDLYNQNKLSIMLNFKHTTLIILMLLTAGFLYGQNSHVVTEKITITDGATNGFILKSDAAGNGSWINPTSIFPMSTSNWGLNGANLYNLNTGNVGIGTNLPTVKLQVMGTVRTGLIQTNSNKIDINILGTGNRTSYIDFHADDVAPAQSARLIRFAGADGNFTLQQQGDGDIVFRNEGTSHMFVKPNGRVGIGTNDPSSLLHVDGQVTTGVITTNSTRIEINQFGTGDRTAILDFHGSDAEPDFSARMFRTTGQNGDFRMENRGAGNLVFRTSNIHRAFITSDGKFVVGPAATPSPGNYKLYVEDGILTERVKIATIATTDWADYVFEEDYKLHSLEEIKAFVKEHKHLPNVPSAKDVNEKGYELQLMDAKLLEKIEELYLLTIQLNEDKNELVKQNKLLEESLQVTKEQHQQTVDNILERIQQLENK